MHALSFRIKRAHLQLVAFGKEAVKRLRDMTPARFDLLYALRMAGEKYPAPGNEPGMEQNRLVETLGLHRSTVSKLIARLRKLGWVTNDEVSLWDRRTRDVNLTELGRRRIDKAIRVVLQQHVHRKWFRAFFTPRSHELHVLHVMESFYWTLYDMAERLGDVSALHYDYGVEGLDH